MARRKTHEEFIQEMDIINQNIIILGRYKNNHTKISCKCKICNHEWKTKPMHLLHKHGCPKCAGLARKTHEEFVLELQEKFPSIESLDKYINNHTKMKFKCHICNNEWDATANQLLTSKGCSTCELKARSDKLRKSDEQFLKELSIIYPEVEILEKYVSNKTKLKCRCKLDGYIWDALPSDLLNGRHCPKCSKSWMRTHEEFLSEMSIINPDIEIIGTFKKVAEKIKVKCKKCGNEYETTPNVLLRGHGCPRCTTSIGENRIATYLKNNLVSYTPQYKEDTLRGIGGNPLSFDFYIPDWNILIEFQGIQHEKPVDFFGGEEQFLIQQEHDRRKRKYAEDNNIKLLEIWYYEIKSIPYILDEIFSQVA